MKLKNTTNKVITVAGVHILPDEVKEVAIEANDVVDFFVETGRLVVVKEQATRKRTKEAAAAE